MAEHNKKEHSGLIRAAVRVGVAGRLLYNAELTEPRIVNVERDRLDANDQHQARPHPTLRRRIGVARLGLKRAQHSPDKTRCRCYLT